MPLTLRPKDTLVVTMLDALLAGGIVTDVSAISVMRQLVEAAAAGMAGLSYDLWTLNQSSYISTATDTDLDALGLDRGIARDLGQAASDTVTFTRDPAYIEDIPIPAQTIVQATLADLDQTTVLYRSLAAVTLQPQGRSVSGQGPGTILVSGLNDQVRLNLNGDGARTVTLGNQTTGAGIASALQTAVRALTATTPGNQPAYATFRCDYSTTTPGAYTLRSGTTGPTSSVVVTPATTNTASTTLKLGAAEGGTETVGHDSVDVAVLCDQIGVIGNVGAGQIHTLASSIAGVLALGNLLAFSNGREPASDDAYRQDIRDYVLSLGTGTPAAVARAVYQTLGSDGQRHILSAQVLSGTGNVQVYLCDGRSMTLGCQEDMRLAVEAELLGQGPSGREWVASGTNVGVAPATIWRVDVNGIVYVGPTVNLANAKVAIEAALYVFLYQLPVGASLSYMQLTQCIQDTIREMLGVTYFAPAQFQSTASQMIDAVVGRKPMPGAISMEVVRG